MLTIKTGMASEYAIAKQYAAPGTLVLTGLQTADDLEQRVPKECTGIISFGLCGGLAPGAQIGQTFICDILVTPDGIFTADIAWRKRLFAATGYYERHWWSTGQFNTANTTEQRLALFRKYGCWVIDDETYAVAKFAKERGIAFQVMRSVSDGTKDNLPPAVVNALNADGTDNLIAVIKSAITEPVDPITHELQFAELFKTAMEAKKSLDELRTAAIAVGANFQWE